MKGGATQQWLTEVHGPVLDGDGVRLDGEVEACVDVVAHLAAGLRIAGDLAELGVGMGVRTPSIETSSGSPGWLNKSLGQRGMRRGGGGVSASRCMTPFVSECDNHNPKQPVPGRRRKARQQVWLPAG